MGQPIEEMVFRSVSCSRSVRHDVDDTHELIRNEKKTVVYYSLLSADICASGLLLVLIKVVVL